MRQLITILSFVFVSLVVLITKDNTEIQTIKGCKLMTCTKLPDVEKGSKDPSTVAEDYYQPLSLINRFIIL